jgi:hypothetical protein
MLTAAAGSIIHAAIADVSCLNVPNAKRDGVVTASNRDAPNHGRPNLGVPNHGTRGASPMADTGRCKGSSTLDSRRKPSAHNNRHMVVAEGRKDQNSVAGLHMGVVRQGRQQPREWRPTKNPSAARLKTRR